GTTRPLALALAVAGCAAAPRPPAPPPPPASPAADTAVPLDAEVAALVMRMYAADLALRTSAARALGAMGGAAAGALPELVACAATEPREARSEERRVGKEGRARRAA